MIADIIITFLFLEAAVSLSQPQQPSEWRFENPPLIIEQAHAEETTPDTPTISTIKKVSAEYGIDWKLVYAICLKESGCNPELKCANQRGRCDNGESYGAYQINIPTHDKTRVAMAENFEQATRWTIEHGKKYASDPILFFRSHNGIGKVNPDGTLRNQWYVDGAMEIYKKI